MGGAFLSLSDDEYALFSNPAGLSTRRSGFELMARVNGQVSQDAISSFETFTGLGDSNVKAAVDALDKYKGKPLYGNAGILPYLLTKNFSIGLLLLDTKLNFNISKGKADILAGGLNPNTEVADITFISDSGLVLGYAQEVMEKLSLGVNLKGLFRIGGRKGFTLQEYQNNKKITFDPQQIGGSGIGFDVDLGATYDLDMLPFGNLSRASLVFSNLLATDFSMSRRYGPPPKLNRTMNLGWLTAFEGFSIIDNFNLMVDITDIPLGGETDPNLGARTGSFKKKLHVGLEVPMGRFALRTGLHQGYVTAGFGMNLWLARLDLATYAEETGENVNQPSRRYALTAALGWASAPPAPIPATKAILEKPAAPKPEPKLPKAPQPEIQKPMVPKPEVAPPQQPVQPTKPSSPSQPKMETRPEATKTPSPAKEKL